MPTLWACPTHHDYLWSQVRFAVVFLLCPYITVREFIPLEYRTAIHILAPNPIIMQVECYIDHLGQGDFTVLSHGVPPSTG